MARQRQLVHAPLREALIDIHFDARLSLETIDDAIAPLASRYPKKVDLVEATFQFDRQELSATSSQAAIGRRLESDQGLFVVLARTNGITTSRLKPYADWDELRNEAKSVLGVLHEKTNALPLRRIAVRYINELKIATPIRDFGDYLTAPPVVPRTLPQGIAKFISRVVIPFSTPECETIVTQALESQPQQDASGGHVTILLDIDVFRPVHIQSDDPGLWTLFDQLRDVKNKLFFEHLTEKTLELFA